MVDSTVELRIPADKAVGLGYLYNQRKGMNSLSAGLPSAFCNENKINPPKSVQYQNQDKKINNSTESKMLTILGELEINANIEVAQVNGKGHCDLRNDDEKESAELSFANYASLKCESIGVGAIRPESFGSIKYQDYTHIVTGVCIGKFLHGDIKVTSKSKSKSLKAGGDIGLKACSLPIGGKGSLEYNTSEFDKDYQFFGNLVAKGHGFEDGLLSCGDLASFLNSVKRFEAANASECTAIIKVEMTPLSAIRTLGISKMPFLTTAVMKDAKKVILRLNDMRKYFEEQLIPFVNSEGRSDLVRAAQELKRTAQDMLVRVEYALLECKTAKQASDLKDLCYCAENYSVDLWINIKAAKPLDDFLKKNAVCTTNCYTSLSS